MNRNSETIIDIYMSDQKYIVPSDLATDKISNRKYNTCICIECELKLRHVKSNSK